MRKKGTFSFTLISILIISIFAVLSTNFYPVSAQNGTSVGGVIFTNTTWTKANSPYNLTENVIVNNGTKLILEPGVTIISIDHSLQINGTLYARGTNNDKINFAFKYQNYSANMPSYYNWTPLIDFLPGSTSWNENTSTGSIIENAIMNSNRGDDLIRTTNVSPKINNNILNHTSTQYSSRALVSGIAIEIIGGSPIVCNNYVFSYGKEFQITNSSALVVNNTVKGEISGQYYLSIGGIMISGGAPTIQNNLILEASGDNLCGGIGLDNITRAFILNNTIIKNEPGIRIYGHSCSATIKFNNILDNGFGPTPGQYGGNIAFYAYSDDTSSSNSTITDLANNYWGTSDSSAINQTIRDVKTDIRNCKANYVPFLTQQNLDAPRAEFAISVSATQGGQVYVWKNSAYQDALQIKNFTVIFSETLIFPYITANENYLINAIFVDGSPINLPRNDYWSLELDNVTQDHIIFVDFELNSALAPTATPIPTNSPSPSPSSSPPSTNTPIPTSSLTNAPTQNSTPKPSSNPTDNPSPSPTIPEFPLLFIILALFALTLFSGVFVIKRK